MSSCLAFNLKIIKQRNASLLDPLLVCREFPSYNDVGNSRNIGSGLSTESPSANSISNTSSPRASRPFAPPDKRKA